jgi:ATP-dependent Lon protease
MSETRTLPVLPLRDIVVFPHMVVPLFVGREKSVRALEEVMRGDKQILLATQKNSADDEPQPSAIYDVGVVAHVLQLLKLPDGTVKVLVEGKSRAAVIRFTAETEYFEADTAIIGEDETAPAEAEALKRAVVEQFESYIKLNKKIPPEALAQIPQIEEAGKLADSIAAHLSVKLSDKQTLLEIFNVAKRLERVFALMEGEISVLQVEKKIRSRVKRQMEKTQREYYLNEQMKAIQRELGDQDDARDELMELEKRIKRTRLSKEARAKADAELKKLRNMSPMSAESTVVRNYLDWLLSVPWGKSRAKPIDVDAAEKILDDDHYGLEKVKERILEYLAVQARTGSLKGPILCLVGPPGVGKTSLGKSIAKATSREFVRLSLGGVRDESEIRGHRRTYIGSMPGKVIQSMKKAKTTNALFLLDEIEKMGQDWRGDPASALLEVLDPEQNSTFADHYLEVDYDLSPVMFITTANSLNMPQPLLDRMEIIRIPGYTEDEKLEIAKRHVLPKLMENHGLKAAEFVVPDESIRDLIRYYTREAGVRSLERELGGLARKAVADLVARRSDSITVDAERLAKYAGVRKYRYGESDETTRWASSRAGLDRVRRRHPHDRGGAHARQGPDGRHRQPEGRDEGVRLGGSVLRPRAGDHLRHQADAVREDRRARPRARGRHAQGRPVGRRRHGGRHGQRADGRADPQGHRHDRRDHPARPGAAHRRLEGEAAGGAALGHQDGADPHGERQGPGGDSGQREIGAGDHPGDHGGRGDPARADRPPNRDRVERGGDRRSAPGGGGRRGRRSGDHPLKASRPSKRKDGPERCSGPLSF